MKRDNFTMPLAFPDELIIDNFAGGGGTSTGLEAAFGRPVDIAINHDPEALAMHAINHPRSKSPELARLVQLKGAITRQVNRINREHAERSNNQATGANP